MSTQQNHLGKGNQLMREQLRDFTQHGNINDVWEEANKKIHDFQEGSTQQGRLHCLRVEENLGVLLAGKLEKLKEIDVFILSAAAALHDIGKIKNNKEVDHGARGQEILGEFWKDFLNDEVIAEAVGHIISVHNNGNIESIPEEFNIGAGHPLE